MLRVSRRIALVSVVTLLFPVVSASGQAVGDQASLTVSGPATVLESDTIAVQGTVMQLYGIDGPLQIQPCLLHGQNWDCGLVARRQLEILVQDGPVTCTEYEDPYFTRRAITWGKCEIGGVDLSAEMVRNGWAVALADQTDMYVPLEDAAHEAKLGLWQAEVFERPADWEYKRRVE
jgi:endonuclease YncB( thermonuclease family)